MDHLIDCLTAYLKHWMIRILYLVLSIELINYIGLHEEFPKLIFQVLALCQVLKLLLSDRLTVINWLIDCFTTWLGDWGTKLLNELTD